MKALPVIVVAALLLALMPAAAQASPTQESMFQDDPLIVYGTPARMTKTLIRLKALGVDRIRVSVFWNLVAPAATSAVRPDFDATDPAAYPAANWARYDRIVTVAKQLGLGVNFNVTSPLPRWAASPAPKALAANIQDTYGPSSTEFGLFMKALGTRYSGTYDSLPRVDYWSIWNEPNQGGWLTPQWSVDPRNPKGPMIEAAPAIYRLLVDQAYASLVATGHGKDTILIGETAPKGEQNRQGTTLSIDPLRFLRQLYCLDDNAQFYTGAAAQVRDCPQSDNAATFKAAHPALFAVTGWAHHPYELLLAPTKYAGWADWVTTANLPDLERELIRIYNRYGQPLPTPKGIPLYLTEYGYQTKPPDPFGVLPFTQAAYLNEVEYETYKNPLVRALSQFLLVDDAPVPGVDPKKYPFSAYRTFQSGLRYYGSGVDKPSYNAYRTPIWVVVPTIHRGSRAHVFGLLRAAGAGKRVRIEWRRRHTKAWHVLATRTVPGPRDYLDTRVRVPATGALRLTWLDGRHKIASRKASIVVR